MPLLYERRAAHELPGREATPRGVLSAVPLRSGLATTDQAEPFQDSMRVRSAEGISEASPAAVQKIAEVQDTLRSSLVHALGSGLGAIDQVLPSQDSIRVWFRLRLRLMT